MILSRPSDVEHVRIVQGGDDPVGIDDNHPERELLGARGVPVGLKNEEGRTVQDQPFP
jgi:hypothetical protein